MALKPADLKDPEKRAAALAYATEIERIALEARRTALSEPRPLGHVPALVGYSLPALRDQMFPPRRALLLRGDQPIIREGYIGEIYAMRGLGKTYLAHTLAITAATGTRALGFYTEAPCRVLIVDGEMGGPELQERIGMLLEKMGESHTENITIVAADWQDEFLPRLDTAEGQAALEPYVAHADLIILDNRSCLFDPEGEKDPTAWQPAQEWLLSLRRRGKAIIVIHHANRQGGARGHSKPEDVMNFLINLTRPDDYTADQGARFVVEFDKSRGAYSAAVAPFTAALTADGWQTEPAKTEDSAAQKIREYLRATGAVGERPKTATSVVSGAKVNRSKGLQAFVAMRDAGEIVEHPAGGFALAVVKADPGRGL